VVVIVTGVEAAMLIANVCEAVWAGEPESVTRRVNEKLPDVVGVPAI
jgi:hypothetical protein